MPSSEITPNKQLLQMNDQNLRSTATRVSRAESHIYKLVEKKILTPGGAAWLIPALDIFHDKPFNPAGYPDGYNGASVSMVLPLSLNIRKPTAIPPGTNWTCYIYSTPLATNCPISPAGIALPATTNLNFLPVMPADGATFGINLLNVHGAADGANMGIFAQTTNTHIANIGLETLQIPTGFRVTAVGYEVYNTTAKLSLQGMSTHFRLTDVTSTRSTVNLVEASTRTIYPNSSATCYEFPQIPATASQALQYPGSVQWEARHGNYTMIPFSTVVNPPQVFESVGFYFKDTTTNFPIGRFIAENVVQTVYPIPATYGFQKQVILPLQMCGSFYTGLSDQTTLTINLKVMLERMPSVQSASEQPLVLTSSMAVPRDPFALAIYSEAIRDLPISVFVSENAFGEWFMDVANKVLNAAMPVLSMIPHPIAQALAQAAKPLEEVTRKTSPATQKATALVSVPKQIMNAQQQQTAPLDLTPATTVRRTQAQNKKRKRSNQSTVQNGR
jgi:hypothetical protein